MKTSLFIVVCGLLIGEDMFAQKQENASYAQISKPCETTFITIGTGLNSNYGIVGLGVDFKLMNKIQGAVSGGLGSWGFKSAGELRYFYSGCMQSGSAVAAGLAYASGLPEMETEMELSNEETKNVTLELGAQTNLQLSWYKSLAIKEHHRFFVQVGYSFPITGISYKVTSGETLSDVSKTTMKMLAPGGVLIATGFGFGF
jgi:hypothetical protein